MHKITEAIRQMTVTGVDFVNTYLVGREAYPLINGGRYRCGLFLTVAGDECYTCQTPKAASFRTHPGTVLFLPQGAAYRITLNEPHSDVRVIDFSLLGDLPEPFLLEVKHPERVLSLFAEAEREWNRREPMSEVSCRARLLELLSLLGAEADAYAPSQKRRQIEAAATYLHTHYADRDFQIAPLHRIAGLSQRYFNALFFEEYRQTPKEYATALRMTRAKELLMTEKLSVAAIAESLGYCDAFHFSKSFKQQTGLTPTQFRQQSGEKAAPQGVVD